MELGILTNLKTLISNMTIVFFKCWPKSIQVIQKDPLIPRSKNFLFLMKLCNSTNSDILISYFFKKIAVQKYSNKAILVSNLKFFILHEICISQNSSVLISNIATVFLQILPQHTHIRQFWSPGYRFFCRKVCTKQQSFQGNSSLKLLK